MPVKTGALSVRAVPDKANITGPSVGDLKVAVCGSGPLPSNITRASAIVFPPNFFGFFSLCEIQPNIKRHIELFAEADLSIIKFEISTMRDFKKNRSSFFRLIPRET